MMVLFRVTLTIKQDMLEDLTHNVNTMPEFPVSVVLKVVSHSKKKILAVDKVPYLLYTGYSL